MNTCYFDQPHTTDTAQTHLAAEIARYLQARQHLGRSIVICHKPTILLALTRKHWLKRIRNLQKERASTINAEKILRLSNTITHMHRMNFTPRPPEADPRAHVFFITPEETALLPINTYSVYLSAPLSPVQVEQITSQLPANALVTDFCHTLPIGLPLRPKADLEAHIMTSWQTTTDFLAAHYIHADQLAASGPQQFTLLDDALDTLLGSSQQFLQTASELQHTFELAQPVALPNQLQRQYDMLILLAHRVQALSPSTAFAARFTYDLTSDETFFLHDTSTDGDKLSFAGALSQAIHTHQQAGRTRLARALHFAVPRY